MKLRKAVLADLDELAAMSSALSPALSWEEHRRRVERELDSHQTLLVVFDGETAGYLVFRIRQDKDDGSNVVEVHRLFIKPSFRRRGLAKMAMSLLTRDHFPLPARVFLSVSMENEEARAFYKAVGFTETFVTMRKSLTRSE